MMRAKIPKSIPKTEADLKPTERCAQRNSCVFYDEYDSLAKTSSTPATLLILSVRAFTKYALKHSQKEMIELLLRQIGFDHIIPFVNSYIRLVHPLENGLALPSYLYSPAASFLKSPTLVVKPIQLQNEKWVPSIQLICEKCSSSMCAELSNYGTNSNWVQSDGPHSGYSYLFAYCMNCKEKERPLVALMQYSTDLRLLEMEAKKERLKKEDADLATQIAERKRKAY